MKIENLKQIAEAFSLEKLAFAILEIEQNNLILAISKLTEVQELYENVLKEQLILQNIITNLEISELENTHSKSIELNIKLLHFQTKSINELNTGVLNSSIIYFGIIDKIKKFLNSFTNLIFKEINLREINQRQKEQEQQQDNIVPTPIVDWKDYEERIYKKYKTSYPDATIIYDKKEDGKYSKTKRQIDILIEQVIVDEKIRIVVECKHYSNKIDVKPIENFVTFLEQVKADKGIFITNLGFTEGAKNTATEKGITLKVVSEKEIESYQFDFDDFINFRIQHLKFSKKDFLERQKFNTNYTDLHRTSFEKRQIVYKEGYTNTEYFAYKKLLEGGLRTFRDFPEIPSIKLITIANKQMPDYQDVKYLYWVSITFNELAKFCDLDISILRKDIKIWREKTSNILTKNNVNSFAKNFVKEQIYSEANLEQLCK